MRWVAAVLVVGCLATGARAEDKGPTTAPSEPNIGAMHVQTLAGMTCLCGEVETSLQSIAADTMNLMTELQQTLKDNKVQVSGGPVFIYHDMTGDPTQRFKLQVGIPVAEKIQAAGKFKVVDLKPFRCATVLYTGAMAQIGQAYQGLMPMLWQGGMQPTGETREYYLYWEKPESPNNVVQVSAGIR